MTNENFTASPELTSASQRRRVFKWIIASVVAVSLFGTGFAIAFASSRRVVEREASRPPEMAYRDATFPTNQSVPYAGYSPTTVRVAQNQVQSTSSYPQTTLPTATNIVAGFPLPNNPAPPSNAYVNHSFPQPTVTYSGVYTAPVVGVPLTDSSEEQLANQATGEILNKLRSARGDERDELMTKLRSAVSEQFDIRHATQTRQIEEVEKQLQKSKELHKKRAEKKDEIVNRRIGQLLNDPDELDWNRNVVGQNYVPRYGYSLPPNSLPPNNYTPGNNAGWISPGYTTNYPGQATQVPPSNPQVQYFPQTPPGFPSQNAPATVAPQRTYRSEDASPTPRKTKQPTQEKQTEKSTEATPSPVNQPPEIGEEANGDSISRY